MSPPMKAKLPPDTNSQSLMEKKALLAMSQGPATNCSIVEIVSRSPKSHLCEFSAECDDSVRNTNEQWRHRIASSCHVLQFSASAQLIQIQRLLKHTCLTSGRMEWQRADLKSREHRIHPSIEPKTMINRAVDQATTGLGVDWTSIILTIVRWLVFQIQKISHPKFELEQYTSPKECAKHSSQRRVIILI